MEQRHGQGPLRNSRANSNALLLSQGMTLEQAKRYATFNARVESLTAKPMSRTAFQARQRCVIPLTGFWGWPELLGKKIRTRIDRPDGKPLLVAGIWNRVMALNGPLESCTVMTRPPTPDLENVQGRLPALPPAGGGGRAS